MTPEVDLNGFDRFRPYLQFLARISWDSRLQAKLDPSDLVQQTLQQAQQAQPQFRGATDAERAAWLRQILVRVMAHAARDFGRGKRDLAREHSLQQFVEQSSLRLDGWLVDDDSTPSRKVESNERAQQIATAVERLPEAQRDAIVLHFWQGHPVPEVAQLMDRSPAAVAGLIHRGLKALRTTLNDLEPT